MRSMARRANPREGIRNLDSRQAGPQGKAQGRALQRGRRAGAGPRIKNQIRGVSRTFNTTKFPKPAQGEHCPLKMP